MQIEYMRGCENAFADALSRLDLMAIDSNVLTDFALGVFSYVRSIANVDSVDARTD